MGERLEEALFEVLVITIVVAAISVALWSSGWEIRRKPEPCVQIDEVTSKCGYAIVKRIK